MSARRVWRNGQYVWIPEGPSGCRTEPKHFVGGALVTGGPAGKAPWYQPVPLTGEALAEARRRFHPHGRKVVAA